MNDAMATAAAAQMARDELWKRRPPLDPDCEHDLLLLLMIEVRQSVVCRKCGGLDAETSGRILTEPVKYEPWDGRSIVRALDGGPRVTLEENRGEEETG